MRWRRKRLRKQRKRAVQRLGVNLGRLLQRIRFWSLTREEWFREVSRLPIFKMPEIEPLRWTTLDPKD